MRSARLAGAAWATAWSDAGVLGAPGLTRSWITELVACALVSPPLTGAMQARHLREGLYKKRPTLTGIAQVLRSRGFGELMRVRV
jgi:hypothetical protein